MVKLFHFLFLSHSCVRECIKRPRKVTDESPFARPCLEWIGGWQWNFQNQDQSVWVETTYFNRHLSLRRPEWHQWDRRHTISSLMNARNPCPMYKQRHYKSCIYHKWKEKNCNKHSTETSIKNSYQFIEVQILHHVYKAYGFLHSIHFSVIILYLYIHHFVSSSK